LHGVQKLWLDTSNQEVVQRAISTGRSSKVEIGLIINPWRGLGNGSEPDRTLFGDAGSEIENRLTQSSAWKMWMAGPNKSPLHFEQVITPSDPGVTERWQSLTTLAHINGISGIALENTQPPGYEPKRLPWHSVIGPLEWAYVGHGYSDPQRLAFLRAHEADPIDFADPEIYTEVDVSQPFFVEKQDQGSSSNAAADKWRSELSTRNREETLKLVKAIGKQLWIEMRPEAVNTMLTGDQIFANWQPGQELPIGVGQQTIMFDPGPNGMYFKLWATDESTPFGVNCAQWLQQMSAVPADQLNRISLVFDFTRLPVDQFGAILNRWFAVTNRS
jgi:hypothetical protein